MSPYRWQCACLHHTRSLVLVPCCRPLSAAPGRAVGVCRQTSTLRQIEAYNEEMKNEIAVTRRATYKAEEAVQQLEKQKLSQDNLIERLQEQLKSLHQAATLRSAQVCHVRCLMTLQTSRLSLQS